MATNIQEFVQGLELAKRVPAALTAQAHRNLAVEGLRELQLRSPKLSGAFMASWTWSADTAEEVTQPKGQPLGINEAVAEARLADAKSRAASLKGFEDSVFANGQPYGNRLNSGWSAMAPSHFVEMAIEAAILAEGLRAQGYTIT